MVTASQKAERQEVVDKLRRSFLPELRHGLRLGGYQSLPRQRLPAAPRGK